TGELKTESQVQVTKALGPLKVTECLPQQVTLKPGEDLLLSMKIESPKPLTAANVTVFKDDHPLSGKDGAKVATSEQGIKVTQAMCTPLSSGMYRIEVSTPDGSLSNSCLVQVIGEYGLFPLFSIAQSFNSLQ